MSLAVELIGAHEQAEERSSRILRWIFRIAGLATLAGAMWIILWIDNRPTGQTASASNACDSVHCRCSRVPQERATTQPQ